MIPTAIVVGLLVGRWWVVPLVALGWVVALLALETIGAGQVPGAVVLAAANAAAGVLAHRALVRAFTLGRRRRPSRAH